MRECRWSCGGFVVGTVSLHVPINIGGESFFMLMKGGSSLYCLTRQACGQCLLGRDYYPTVK